MTDKKWYNHIISDFNEDRDDSMAQFLTNLRTCCHKCLLMDERLQKYLSGLNIRDRRSHRTLQETTRKLCLNYIELRRMDYQGLRCCHIYTKCQSDISSTSLMSRHQIIKKEIKDQKPFIFK